MGHSSAALNLILDPGERLLLQRDLATLMIRFMLAQMWLGGLTLLAIQETVVAGLLVGGLEWCRESA